MVNFAEFNVTDETSEPKYEQVRKIILSYINRLPESVEYLPYEHELEAELEVSKRTVRRALEALRNEGVIETVRKRGSKIISRDFPKSNTNHNVSSLTDQTIASIIVSDKPGSSRTGFMPWQITEAIEKQAYPAGAAVAVYNLRENKWKDREKLFSHLAENGVKWTFLYPHENISPCSLERLIDNGIKPAIYVDSLQELSILNIAISQGVDWIMSNHASAIYQALKANFQQNDFIAYVGSMNHWKWEEPRMRAAEKFANEMNIPFEKVFEDFKELGSEESTEEHTVLSGYAGAEKLLDKISQYQRPLIMGANDKAAEGILNCFDDENVEVPSQVEVLGYDDARECRASNLSTFGRDSEVIAKKAMDFCYDFYRNTNEGFNSSRGEFIYPRYIKRMTTN
jgi:DNA-binding LacI/PurR family transcriptional regulator